MYNDKYMKIAIKQAKKAEHIGEIPVGAVIVRNNSIISKAYNKIETNNDPMSHAEILAIKKATKKIHNWRLNDCDLYVTLEPCSMCMEIINKSRINNVYYSTKKQEKNFSKTKYKHINTLEFETTDIIQSFFRKRR